MNRFSDTYHRRTLLILVVFAFSLLPRQMVHNFVTNHQHIRHAGYPGEHLLSPETISCSGDNIFLNHAFISVDGYSQHEPTEWKAAPAFNLPGAMSACDLLMASSRGPPALFI
jgi:hypothetical protein